MNPPPPRRPADDYHIKVRLSAELVAPAVVRRFPLREGATLRDLRAAIRAAVPGLEADAYTVTYPDRDGDNVLVETDTDWAECVGYHRAIAHRAHPHRPPCFPPPGFPFHHHHHPHHPHHPHHQHHQHQSHHPGGGPPPPHPFPHPHPHPPPHPHPHLHPHPPPPHPPGIMITLDLAPKKSTTSTATADPSFMTNLDALFHSWATSIATSSIATKDQLAATFHEWAQAIAGQSKHTRAKLDALFESWSQSLPATFWRQQQQQQPLPESPVPSTTASNAGSSEDPVCKFFAEAVRIHDTNDTHQAASGPEAILGEKRNHNGQPIYLVKWADSPIEQSSWQGFESLLDENATPCAALAEWLQNRAFPGSFPVSSDRTMIKPHTNSSSSKSTSTTRGDSLPGPFAHNAVCDGCNIRIRGLRFKCKDCPDYDLCSICIQRATAMHPSTHQFSAYVGPVTAGASSKPVHMHITCDACSAFPIVGNRYKCAHCPDFDLCEQCNAKGQDAHDANHMLIQIRNPLVAHRLKVSLINDSPRVIDQSVQAAVPTSSSVAQSDAHDLSRESTAQVHQPSFSAKIVEAAPLPMPREFVRPGEKLVRTFRLLNNGVETWPSTTLLVHTAGSLMPPTRVHAVIHVGSLAPEATIVVSIPMFAPDTEGKANGTWTLAYPFHDQDDNPAPSFPTEIILDGDHANVVSFGEPIQCVVHVQAPPTISLVEAINVESARAMLNSPMLRPESSQSNVSNATSNMTDVEIAATYKVPNNEAQAHPSPCDTRSMSVTSPVSSVVTIEDGTNYNPVPIAAPVIVGSALDANGWPLFPAASISSSHHSTTTLSSSQAADASVASVIAPSHIETPTSAVTEHQDDPEAAESGLEYSDVESNLSYEHIDAFPESPTADTKQP